MTARQWNIHCGVGIVIVAVQHHRGSRRDAGAPGQRLELLLTCQRAPGLVLELRLPVPADGAGNVRLVVSGRIRVYLDDAGIQAGDEESLRRAVELYTGPLLEGCLEE